MSFTFVDKQWHSVFSRAASRATREILIITPFIQKATISELLKRRNIKARVITRFALRDFYDGVSDLDALEFLLKRGSAVKGIKNLHAKLYIFDTSRAILTSANLTQAALYRNHELGLETNNSDLIRGARSYFETLWADGGPPLTLRKLEDWQKSITEVKLRAGRVSIDQKLKDHGKDTGFEPHPTPGSRIRESSTQWFVKFFGEGHNRVPWGFGIVDEVKRSGCHWACTYPRGKRPRNVRDGAVMFMARLVQDPKDILIFGRGIGMKHVKGRDDATPSDVSLQDGVKSFVDK